MRRHQLEDMRVHASDCVGAACARHNNYGLAAREYELDIALAERRIDGNDDCPEINAGEIERRQFTAVRKHSRDSIALAHASPMELRSQGTSLPVKLAVSNFLASEGIHQEDVLLAARYDIQNSFADGHFAGRHCVAKGVG